LKHGHKYMFQYNSHIGEQQLYRLKGGLDQQYKEHNMENIKRSGSPYETGDQVG